MHPRNVFPELELQKISIHRVRAALTWAKENRNQIFDRRRLADMSTYVAEYRRYALARQA